MQRAFYGNQLCILGISQLMHQAALVTGDVILVNNTLLSSLVERFHGSVDQFFLVVCAGFDRQAGVLQSGTGDAADGTIAQSASFILTIALLL